MIYDELVARYGIDPAPGDRPCATFRAKWPPLPPLRLCAACGRPDTHPCHAGFWAAEHDRLTAIYANLGYRPGWEGRRRASS